MIRITRMITADDAFGESWPPPSNDNWTVIRRLRGFTVWRAIRIVQPEPPSTGVQSISDGNCLGKGDCDGN
jgi:hypothetical protein